MTRARKATAGKTQRRRKNYSAAMLDTLIDEATVDAYDDSEQKAGFFTMLENHLATPFATEVLGMIVMVETVDMTDDEEIVAMCVRDRWRQPIRIIELPLPDPPPEGAEWIEAYGRWARRRYPWHRGDRVRSAGIGYS